MATTVADIIASGLLSARPAASSSNLGYLYFATDENGGTLFRSTGSTWVQVASGVTEAMSNPMTTAGDIIIGGTAGTQERLAIGGSGEILTVVSGVPSWEAAPGGGVTFYGCRLTHNADQSISDSTLTDLNFNTEIFDVGGYHDPATNNQRITIPTGKAGYYHIGGSVRWGAATGGFREINLFLNNTSRLISADQPGIGGTYHTQQAVSTLAYLAEGDYVTVRVYEDSGAAPGSKTASSYAPLFWCQLVGT